jgi:putative transposase
MNQKERLAFAKEAAKSMKTEQDLSDFSRMLNKVTVEAALGAELDDHLGYDKH